MREPLSNPQIRKLKALAQRMDPTLKLGRGGVSPGFLESLKTELDRHELVKVKLTEFKDQRKEIAPRLAEESDSALVTLLGNVIVLYREHPDPEKRKIQF